jgi:hypothetical protein
MNDTESTRPSRVRGLLGSLAPIASVAGLVLVLLAPGGPPPRTEGVTSDAGPLADPLCREPASPEISRLLQAMDEGPGGLARVQSELPEALASAGASFLTRCADTRAPLPEWVLEQLGRMGQPIGDVSAPAWGGVTLLDLDGDGAEEPVVHLRLQGPAAGEGVLVLAAFFREGRRLWSGLALPWLAGTEESELRAWMPDRLPFEKSRYLALHAVHPYGGVGELAALRWRGREPELVCRDRRAGLFVASDLAQTLCEGRVPRLQQVQMSWFFWKAAFFAAAVLVLAWLAVRALHRRDDRGRRAAERLSEQWAATARKRGLERRRGLRLVDGCWEGPRFAGKLEGADVETTLVQHEQAGQVCLDLRLQAWPAGTRPPQVDLGRRPRTDQTPVATGDVDFDSRLIAQGRAPEVLALLSAPVREAARELESGPDAALEDGVLTARVPLLPALGVARATPEQAAWRLQALARLAPRLGLGTETIEQRLLENLRADPCAEMRRRSLLALVSRGGELAEVREALRLALASDDVLLRLEAAAAEGSDSAPLQALDVTEAALAALVPQAAERAAELLGDRAEPEAEPLLLELLRRPEPPVRLEAARALGRTGSAASVELLLALARDGADAELLQAMREAVAAIQGRLSGAEAGRLSLAEAAESAGALSFEHADAGALSLPPPG